MASGVNSFQWHVPKQKGRETPAAFGIMKRCLLIDVNGRADLNALIEVNDISVHHADAAG